MGVITSWPGTDALHVRDERSIEVHIVDVGAPDRRLEQLALAVERRTALGRRHHTQILERGAQPTRDLR